MNINAKIGNSILLLKMNKKYTFKARKYKS